MEPDLPLLEISGEDDSLIQQTPTSLNDAVKVADSFFSLSPMQLPISPIKRQFSYFLLFNSSFSYRIRWISDFSDVFGVSLNF